MPYHPNGTFLFNLQKSDFAVDGYCSNNFNDLFSAFVTLFELMAVNQWHVVAQGHVLVRLSLPLSYPVHQQLRHVQYYSCDVQNYVCMPP